MKQMIATALLALATGIAYAGASPMDVMACIRGAVPTSPSVSTIAVTTTDLKTGNSASMAGRLYTARADGTGSNAQLWAMLRLDKPAPVKGTAYLVRTQGKTLHDEMFVYLPSVGRVRRITGSYANKPLFGTTFSYFDFKEIWNAFADLTPVTVGAPQSIGGRSAHVLHLKPANGSDVNYTSVTVWIGQKTCLPLRAEFKRNGKVVKRFTTPLDKISLHDGHWQLGAIHMRDLVKKQVSQMRIESTKTLPGPPGQYFDPKTFSRKH